MNEVQEPKKKSAGVWIAIGCGALFLVGVCAVLGLFVAGGAFWARAVRPPPPTPVTTPTAPVAPVQPQPQSGAGGQ